MKRLTMNRVAWASLRHYRKSYASLAAGIFLAVYLACTAVLCIHGTLEAGNEQMARRLGRADTILLNSPHVTDEQIRSSNLFDQLGHIYVTASVENTDVYTGYYDKTANHLMYRRCVEGRMPEKAGEIAAEQSALDKLGLENAAVGDVFTWNMQPFEGLSEQRSYTLVGILSEQTVYLNPDRWFSTGFGTVQLPAILISADDPPFPVGSATVHRVMTDRPLVTLNQIQNWQDGLLHMSCHISRVTGRITPYDSTEYEMERRAEQAALWLMLGGALLLSACVGIASAMESMLDRKTEDIGMLRAVGATRRQIRRLLGRDAWLLAIIALPVGVALGCLTCWGLSRMMPEKMVFHPSPWLLLPVLGVSGLCVFLSSALPLRRASRQTPMGVLRDTALLRRARRFHSRRAFDGPQLIALRQFRLHPLRQAGSICMVALMLICLMTLCVIASLMDWSALGYQEAFILSGGGQTLEGVENDPFVQELEAGAGLTQSDMHQLRSLPLVSRVDMRLSTRVILQLPDDTPGYFQTQYVPLRLANGYETRYSVRVTDGGLNTAYLDSIESSFDLPDEFHKRDAELDAAKHRALQQATGVEQNMVPMTVIVATLDDENFSGNLVAGDVDLAALDSGREVLVYAPNIVARAEGDRGGMHQTNQFFDDEISPAQWDAVLINDFFSVGQTLPLMQLAGVQADSPTILMSEDALRSYYGGMERTSLAPVVGGILKGHLDIGGTWFFCPCLITTEKGAVTLGLRSNGVESACVSLASAPDVDTEALLARRIERIGNRHGMTFTNSLETRRQDRAYQMQIIALFGGMALLFFAVSVSMQVTSIARRIRADERMVGTFRAVGADETALARCYRLPVLMAAVCGLILAAAVCGAIRWAGLLMFRPWALLAALPMAALNVLCALAGVRGQLRRVMGRSIIENIREL